MPLTHTRADLPGRILAVLVFLLGIGLLCSVFGLAWTLFHAPVQGLELPVKAGQTAPPAASIGIALTAFVQKVILLALMTLAGSLISGKGIHLYYSAAHGAASHEAAVTPARNGHSTTAPETATESPIKKSQA